MKLYNSEITGNNHRDRITFNPNLLKRNKGYNTHERYIKRPNMINIILLPLNLVLCLLDLNRMAYEYYTYGISYNEPKRKTTMVICYYIAIIIGILAMKHFMPKEMFNDFYPAMILGAVFSRISFHSLARRTEALDSGLKDIFFKRGFLDLKSLFKTNKYVCTALEYYDLSDNDGHINPDNIDDQHLSYTTRSLFKDCRRKTFGEIFTDTTTYDVSL